MTTHDADVAAVLAEAVSRYYGGVNGSAAFWAADRHAVEVALQALTAAGIRCLYVPEGVEVGHGARLKHRGGFLEMEPLYTIEPPEATP